ncbi:hypothetical protein AYL99_12045 [Fonsecaea erecta]|uniref:Uncharacterized protein n=1 Tax=Fonsecaea erecta TaxID=1367422 RepID=A0A178Z2M5_9EURO|nr:hypothetical protein AYL99_12045 [Fonsecaea erecta]OAP53761.1 hypothetical protein AYL99_12045 [Fonsecaea erecta]
MARTSAKLPSTKPPPATEANQRTTFVYRWTRDMVLCSHPALKAVQSRCHYEVTIGAAQALEVLQLPDLESAASTQAPSIFDINAGAIVSDLDDFDFSDTHKSFEALDGLQGEP